LKLVVLVYYSTPLHIPNDITHTKPPWILIGYRRAT